MNDTRQTCNMIRRVGSNVDVAITILQTGVVDYTAIIVLASNLTEDLSLLSIQIELLGVFQDRWHCRNELLGNDELVPGWCTHHKLDTAFATDATLSRNNGRLQQNVRLDLSQCLDVKFRVIIVGVQDGSTLIFLKHHMV